jgi:hypothetical protein
MRHDWGSIGARTGPISVRNSDSVVRKLTRSLTLVSLDNTIKQMSKKHDRTLAAIFAEPVRTNVEWSEVEAMLAAFGAEISQGEGSRVRIALNGVRAVFHRPHPRKETDKGALRSMRRFLTEAGVTP